MAAHDDDDRVVIEANGTIRIEGAELQRRVRSATGHWQWIEASPDLTVLARASRDGTRARWLMAGEIMSPTTVMEVMSMLVHNGWSGELGVHAAGISRHLSIGDGILRAARSGAPNERLGELLVGMDLLSVEQLEQCVSGDKERRLGELALERGYVTREQLFEALRTQMRLIFQNALLEPVGHYALLQTRDEEASAPAFQEHIPLQELLMDSVRRIDEMAVFRQRIPNGDVCPVLSERGFRVTLRASLRPVLALSDGEHSVLDIAHALHKDEYETTRLVCHLLQIGAIEIRDQHALNSQQALRMIGRFNQVLRRIFEQTHRHARRQDLYRTLTAWVDDTPPLALFFHDTLSIEGELGPERVVARLAASDEEPPLESLHQALQELAAFAMLSAGSMLPRDAERALSQFVRHKLTQLRRAND
jgi:hypothetical protein